MYNLLYSVNVSTSNIIIRGESIVIMTSFGDNTIKWEILLPYNSIIMTS